MPKISNRRQITIPKEKCKTAHIKPGDSVETFVYYGQITNINKSQFYASAEVESFFEVGRVYRCGS